MVKRWQDLFSLIVHQKRLIVTIPWQIWSRNLRAICELALDLQGRTKGIDFVCQAQDFGCVDSFNDLL